MSTTDKPLDVRVRAATLEDLDAIVEVVLKAMQFDPQWNYRFVHKREFREDHVKFTRLLYQEFISSSNDDWLVIIAVDADPQQQPARIVGFSVWDISYIKKTKYGTAYEPQNPMLNVARAGGSQRRDVDLGRQAAFHSRISQTNKTSFSAYGDRQLHLQILGVNPRFWRHRVGSRLVGWGMDKAKREKIPLTLMAGSMGLKLYEYLGFKSIGTCVVQVPGEEEVIDCKAMVYEPETA